MDKQLRNIICNIISLCIFISSVSPSVVLAEDIETEPGISKPITITVGNGSKDQFKTITEALNSIKHTPTENSRITIAISKGTYEEPININIPYITLKNNHSENPDDVTITYDKASGHENEEKNFDIEKTGTITIEPKAVGFKAENITVRNSYNLDNNGKNQLPAAALVSLSDKAIFDNCKFYGRQNTLYLSGSSKGIKVYGSANQARLYFNKCFIEGSADIILGDSTAAFENCRINMSYHKNGGHYTASNATLFNIGFVFLKTKFFADSKYTNGTVKLARAWQSSDDYPNYGSNSVFIECTMPKSIDPKGYGTWDYATNTNKVRYMEYGTKNSEENIEDLSLRVSWAKILTDEQYKYYNTYNILRGSDNWNPTEQGRRSNRVNVLDITLDKYNITIPKGETNELKPFILPVNAENRTFTFSSFDDEIAKVDSNGTITALNEGKTSIKVTANDGEFTAIAEINVSAPLTGTPEVENVSIIGNDIPLPGDILRGEYKYKLSSDQKIDNAKVQWVSVNSKTGDEILLKEGRGDFAKEYTVRQGDIGNKIKFVVIPETITTYGKTGNAGTDVTINAVGKPNSDVIKVYLRESFSDFYLSKYREANSSKYPLNKEEKPIWEGSPLKTNSSNVWSSVTSDGNSTIGATNPDGSLLEYIPGNTETPWENINLEARMRFSPTAGGFTSDSYFNIYTAYNKANGSYYRLNIQGGENTNSLKLYLYKKESSRAKEVLLASDEKGLLNNIAQNAGYENPWFRINQTIVNGKIDIKFTIDGEVSPKSVISIVDTSPVKGGGYTALESYGKSSALLIDSLVVEQVFANVENPNSSKVFIIGDSTAKTYGPAYTTGGWGEYIQNYFDSSKVNFINKSENETSSRSFINRGMLNQVLEEIGKGDYLFIQFGGNDSNEKLESLPELYVDVGTPDKNGIYPVIEAEKVNTPRELISAYKSMPYKDQYYSYENGSYKWYLKQYIDGVKSKGAIPVLVSPSARLEFDDKGLINDSFGVNNSYITAMKQLAGEMNVEYIDMFSATKQMYEDLGQRESEKLHDIKPDGSIDVINYGKYGAFKTAEILSKLIEKSELEIGNYLTEPKKTVTKTESLREAVLYIVGDSTVCDHNKNMNYAIDKKGWGVYLGDYLSDSIKVNNLAVDQASSKSFISEENYKTMIDTIKPGDYLMIQFGAYDSKQNTKDENLKYTDPKLDIENSNSFKHFLYEYYLKPAFDKKANPILISPVSERKFDSSGKFKNTYEDYTNAVKELAYEFEVPFIDLNNLSYKYYESLGIENSKNIQALYKDKLDGEKGIDNSNFNFYGAGEIAEIIADEINNTSSTLKNYVDKNKSENITASYITRADYIVLLMNVLGKEGNPITNFSDVSKGKYYTNAIGLAKEMAVVTGDNENNFKPEEYITRQDMMVITARALKIEGKLQDGDIDILNNYSDSSYISSYAKELVASIIQSGIISGSKDNKISPNSFATKEQSIIVINKIYNMTR